jgi:hypothetical protein
MGAFKNLKQGKNERDSWGNANKENKNREIHMLTGTFYVTNGYWTKDVRLRLLNNYDSIFPLGISFSTIEPFLVKDNFPAIIPTPLRYPALISSNTVPRGGDD